MANLKKEQVTDVSLCPDLLWYEIEEEGLLVFCQERIMLAMQQALHKQDRSVPARGRASQI